jgi:hypothetical protein
MNLKTFGTKWLWPDQASVAAFACGGTEENHENPYSG